MESPRSSEVSLQNLSPQEEKALGPELSETIKLLMDYLAPFEEWVQLDGLSNLDVLRILKEEGLFKDLRIIKTLGEQHYRRVTELEQAALKIYGRRGPKVARSVAPLNTALKALIERGTLLSEILQQVIEQIAMEALLETGATLFDAFDSKQMRVQKAFNFLLHVRRSGVEQASMQNLNQLMLILAEQEIIAPTGDDLKERARQTFVEARWSALEHPGGLTCQHIIKIQGSEHDIEIAPLVGSERNGNSSSLELAQIKVVKNVGLLQQNGMIGVYHVGALVGLSRVHDALVMPGNGYISLEPLFKALGHSEFYELLRRQAWIALDESRKTGAIQESKDIFEEDEEDEGEESGVENPELVEETVSITREAAQETIELKAERSPQKGVRQKTSNLNAQAILRALKLLEINPERQNGTSHSIVAGRNKKTGNTETMSVPLSLNKGSNSAPYVAALCQKFGLTREEFLNALSKT